LCYVITMFEKLYPWRKNKPSFDFNRAVEKARLDYPAETQDITFVEWTTRQEAERQLAEWLRSTPDYKRERRPEENTAEETAGLHIFMSEGAMSMRNEETGKGILIIPADPAGSLFQQCAPDIPQRAASAFLFYHELGHLVIDEASPLVLKKAKTEGCDKKTEDELDHKGEILSDCFAVFSGLHARALDRKDIERFTFLREENERRYGDKNHNSAPALQAFAAEYKAKAVRNMTPQTLKETAVAHGLKFDPRA
jgi:hypothetical protein